MTMENPADKRRKASTPEVIRINNLLQEHGGMADGFFGYHPGWDDARIVREVHEELSPATAARIRREMYGNFRSGTKGAHSDEIEGLRASLRALQTELQTTNRDIAELRARADAAADLHAKLCESLSINRVLAVSHLAGRPPLGIKGNSPHIVSRS